MFIRGEIEEDQIKDIRSSLKTGKLLSGNKYLKDIEEKLARKLGEQPIGRPRKKIHYPGNGMWPYYLPIILTVQAQSHVP